MQDTLMFNISITNMTGAVINASSGVEYLPGALQPLFQSTSLNNTFAALADSMSNAIRNGADSSPMRQGVVGMLLTTYHVQWYYIIFPAILLFIGYSFLIIAQMETRKAGIPTFKSNELAVLARGHAAHTILHGTTFNNEMIKRSEKGYVHFFERDMVVDGGSTVSLRRMDTAPGDGMELPLHKRDTSSLSESHAMGPYQSHSRSLSVESTGGVFRPVSPL